MRHLTRALRGIREAAHAHPWSMAGTLVLALTVQVLLPPLVLSLVRKPWTYFTFNPWLKRLPEYLAGSTPLDQKLDFLTRVAVVWFTADGQYGAPEWGFAVDGADLARFLVTAGLVSLWVALWRYQRDLRLSAALRVSGRGGGAVGVFAGVLGLTTGPCSVVGCGAPVLPVVALAFTGLSSGTVLLLSAISRATAIALLVILAAGVVYLGWRVGAATRDARAMS
jgi:hypothetical protein